MDANQHQNLSTQIPKPESLFQRVSSQQFPNPQGQPQQKNAEIGAKIKKTSQSMRSQTNQQAKPEQKEKVEKEEKSLLNSKQVSKVYSLSKQKEQIQRDRNIEIGEKQTEAMKEFNQFKNNWKAEIDFGVLLIDKVAVIVENYYKILPEFERTNEQMELLIVYNTSLLEIMHKFEDHQRKLMNKLKTVSQLYSQVMRQLCATKNKTFRAPQIKFQQSIFSKFNLSELTYIPSPKTAKISQKYQKQLVQLFKTNLLLPIDSSQQVLETKLKELKLMDKNSKGAEKTEKTERTEKSEKEEQFLEIKQKIMKYQHNLNNVDEDNMFYLYKLRNQIRKDLQEVGVRDSTAREQEQESQAKFVEELYRLHVGFSNMSQEEIQKCIKAEKQIQKRLKKQRTKQQQKFIKNYQTTQHDNTQLTKQIKNLKQQKTKLESTISNAKFDKQYKKMKSKSPNPNRSIIQDADNNNNSSEDLKMNSSKRLQKQIQKQMSTDLKKYKDQNIKLEKNLAGFKNKEKTRSFFLNKVKEKAKKMEILLDPQWEEIRAIQHLLAVISRLRNGKKVASEEIKIQKSQQLSVPGSTKKTQQQLNSPFLQGMYDFQTSQKLFCLQTIEQNCQQYQPQLLQNRNKELQKQVKQLRRKNQQNRNIITTKNQDLRKMLQQHETTLRQKNSKINELVKQYERFQNQIKQLKFQNQLFRVKSQCAKKMSEKIIKAVEETRVKDLMSEPLPLISQMLEKLKRNVQDYLIQTQKEEEVYKEKRQISILREGERDQISSKHGTLSDQSALSLKGLFAKSKSKRQSDMLESPNKNQQQNFKNKNRNSRASNDTSLTVLQKQLSLKKTKKKQIQNQIQKLKVDDQFNQKAKSIEQIQKEKQRQFRNIVVEIDKKERSIMEIKADPVGKKANNLSFQEADLSSKKNKQQIKSSTQLGVPTVERKDEKMTYTENNEFLNMSKQKGSGSDKSQISRTQKMQQQPKMLTNFLSLLENNPNDNLDCISERAKQPQTFQKQKTKQIKKNKVETNDSLKGSLKVQMLSSRNRLIEKQEQNKKNSKEKKMETQKKINKKYSLHEKDKEDESLGFQDKSQSKNQTKKAIEEKNMSSDAKKIEKKISLEATLEEKKDKRNSQSDIKVQKSKDKQQSDSKNESSMSQQQWVVPQIRISPVPQKQDSEISQNKQQKSNMNFSANKSRVTNSMMNDMNNYSLNYSDVTKNKISEIESDKKNNSIKKQEKYERKPQKYDKKKDVSERISQIAVEQHQQIMARIEKLGDLDDALDFIALYNRYKQVIICLQQAQAQNRRSKLRYEKFISQLNLNQRTKGFSIEEELYHLKELVKEQKQQIQLFDRKYYEDMINHIKLSGVYIKQHITMMRNTDKLQRQREKLSKKLFL